MEKIIVKPEEVRALGNIVSPKTLSDFKEYDSKVTTGTDTDYGTIYALGGFAGSRLTVTPSRYITPSGTSFSISVTLKNNSNTAITSATVKCNVNDDTVLTATTNSSGVATFTVPLVTDVCEYDLWFTYDGSNSVCGCFIGYHVRTGSSDRDLDLISENEIIQTGDVNYLMATLSSTDCNGEPCGVPGQTVYFFEEYGQGLKIGADHQIIQTGDTDNVYGQLYDTVDGSLIRKSGVTVYFFEVQTLGLKMLADHSIIESGDTDNVYCQLYDTEDGSLIRKSGETIYFFEEVDYLITLQKGTLSSDNKLPLTIKLYDTDMNPVIGELVSLYNGGTLLASGTTTSNGKTINITLSPGTTYNFKATYGKYVSNIVTVVMN